MTDKKEEEPKDIHVGARKMYTGDFLILYPDGSDSKDGCHTYNIAVVKGLNLGKKKCPKRPDASAGRGEKK